MVKNHNKRAEQIVSALEALYEEAVCSLEYDKEKPYQLLIAARLSAQCTDARVNIVTKKLFAEYRSLEDFANADISELEEIIKPCGLYRTKAAGIIGTAKMLTEKFGGEIPGSLDELLTLPGVGRKIANLIMGDVMGKPAIVTDTHCIRIAGRLKLTSNTAPHKIESDLARVIPPEKSNDFCHRLVLFGREYCTARTPSCGICPLMKKELCKGL